MGIRVAVIVGHEKRKPGAVMSDVGVEITEYKYNSEVAKTMKDYAPSRGLEVSVFFRDGVGRLKVRDQALSFKPEIILELHFDASPNKTATGCTVLTMQKYSKHPFIGSFSSLCVGLFGGKIRGAKIPAPTENGFSNVQSPLPLFLLEPFFGSNEDQAALALKNQKEYALGLLDCLEEFYGFETS